MTSESPAASAAETPSSEVELKHGAISFLDALVIGLASTSPAYSLAAVIGPIVALMGVYAPGVLLASFVPMLLIASAFYFLNKADQDCGTTFSWVTRAMGPWFGWIGGWAIAMTGVLVVGSLADTAVRFGLLTVGLDDLAENTPVVVVFTVVVIVVMAAMCVIGTDVSVRFQNALIILQVLSLLVFAGVAIGRVVAGTSTLDAVTPSLTWLNPFAEGGAALTAGLLLGVFTYWGWESAVNLTEETEDSESAPGRAAILSTVVLLVTYLAVAYAVVSYAGPGFLAENEGEEELIFAVLGAEVLGGVGLGAPAVCGDVRARVDADDDHSGIAHRALDGPAGGAAARAGPHPSAVPHARRLHLAGRGHRRGLVRPGQPHQRERAPGLHHGAVAAHRLLLRAHRRRLRRLLPPPAAAQRQEPAAHRCRPGRRRGPAVLAVAPVG
ncbi:MAG: amino acid transporter, partial [Pseudonocardia sp.]|nr:amino acid transporter [Pseudonocardia sp.]